MAMEVEQFEALVARLDPYAAKHPTAYRVRVAILALLGYVYIVGVVVLSVALSVALVVAAFASHLAIVAVKLVIPLLAVLAMAGRAVWHSLRVKFPAPEGRELAEAEAPELFAVVEHLRKQAKAPRLHEVLLTRDFNAAVASVPRLGVLGWPRRYLVLGLPLMQTLTPEQFESVLAHELGHLSRVDSSLGAWVYRLRDTWGEVAAQFEQKEGLGAAAFGGFFNWYAPYFSAYSFVLARARERSADASAKRLVGGQCAADALIRLEVATEYFASSVWPKIVERAASSPEPPANVYEEIERELRREIDPQLVGAVLRASLERRTDPTDSHPCLADRVAALEAEARAPSAVEETAARRLLGAAYDPLTAEMSASWQRLVDEEWRVEHERVLAVRSVLEQLEARDRAELSPAERWQLAVCTEDVRGSDAAFALYASLRDEHPDEPDPKFAVGRILLARDDEEGVALVEAAMREDIDYLIPGCQILYGFLKQRGRDEEARGFYERAVEHSRTLELAEAERETIPFAPVYATPALSASQIDDLRAQLAAYPELAAVYLVRKEVQYLKQKPMYILAFEVHRSWYRSEMSGSKGSLVERLAEELVAPIPMQVVSLAGENAKLKRFVKAVPGSQLL